MGLLNKSAYSKVLISVVGVAVVGVFSISFFNPGYFSALYTNTFGQVKKTNYKAPYSNISLKIDGFNSGDLSLSSFSWEKKSKNKKENANLIFSLPSTVASTEFFSTAASGKHMKTATLSEVQPGGSTFQWKMTDILINSYKIGSEEGSNRSVDYLEFAPKQVSFSVVNPAQQKQQEKVQVNKDSKIQENLQQNLMENIQVNQNSQILQDTLPTLPVNADTLAPAAGGGDASSTDTSSTGGTSIPASGGGAVDTSPQL